MCSNYLTESYVEDLRTGATVLDGLDLVRRADGRLPDLEQSRLANPVGVSTLAFDSRNDLILIQQSEFAQSSKNLWSPSGSGSPEPVDLQTAGTAEAGRPDLVDVIRRGMNRELVEESHISVDAIHDSRVIGYFRWLNKGGKPEYTGVTLLNRPVTALRRRLSEFRWVRGIEVGVPVDFDRLRDDPAAAQHCIGRPGPGDNRFAARMSFPLYLSLRALGDRLAEPAFRDWFFAR
jgi:hypothetical protein